jgi:pimeloyl-ACP methyl ester carboxylesterase
LLRPGPVALAAAALGGFWAYRCRRSLGRDHPPIGRFIEVGGIRLHYIDRGEGVPVVLLHGNGATVEDFTTSGLVDLASHGHRVVAFDRPGFGHSERPRGRRWTAAAQAELLERAFARLAIERPVVVGHSWGALVAVALAARARTELRGLVLMAGYYYPIRRIDVALAAPFALPILGAPLRTVLGPLIGRTAARRLIAAAFAPRDIPARFSRGFPIALCLRPSSLRAGLEETALMIPAAAALQKHYRTLAIPVTILAGAEDRLVESGRHAVRLHREIAHSKLHVFAGIGHMLHHFVPEHVVTAIEAMIRRAGI